MVRTPKDREITISRDTARLLSRATYHEVVLALREMVANAHDAQSPTVEITIRLEDGKGPGGTIVVSDQGEGMDSETFEKVFLRLGSSTREVPRPKRLNRYGRPLIGKFGIGFIAAVPFAEKIRIETATEHCLQVHGVEIDCAEIMETSEALQAQEAGQADTKGASDAPALVTGASSTAGFRFPGWDRDRIHSDPKSFTVVTLQVLTRLAYDSIDAELQGGWYQPKGQRKKEHLTKARRTEFLVNWMSRVLPLGYSGGPKAEATLRAELSKLLPSDYYPLQVFVNGRRLIRPLAKCVFPTDPKPFALIGEKGQWEAKGILWSPQDVIQPYFLRGVAMRVSDMAVGRPSYFNLNEMGRVYGKLQHITGELQLTGFRELLNLDRQSLRGSVETDEFFVQIRAKITEFESELQKKASVMQEARNLKKSVERNRPRRKKRGDRRSAPQAGLADVLVAGDKAKEIADRARDAGIEVVETEGNEIDVPRGERTLRVGRKLGEDLLIVGKGPKRVEVEVQEKGGRMDDNQLADAVLATGGALRIKGGHLLLADDAWAVSNLRLLALLRRASIEKILDEKQVRWLIRELRELYE